MLKVILCVGIVASGKSTWAKEEIKRDPSIIRVNRDDLRVMMSNYVYSPENEKLIIAARNQIISNALKSGRNVIIDDTNLNRRNFEDVCALVNSLGVECMVMEKAFYVDLDEAIARNAKREGFALIPEDVIRKMWKQSGGTQHKFYKGRVEVCRGNTLEFDSGEPASTDMSKPFAILCDLDGTISLFNPIRKNGSVEKRHVGAPARSPYDASKANNDMVNEPVAEVLERMSAAGYQIIFCSGREDRYRDQTVEFLKKNVGFPYELIMRTTGDSRKDSIVKEELYQKYVAEKYNVFLVLDDRNQVVDFWRSKGFACWQVNPGDF